jgi:hypothetical protein
MGRRGGHAEGAISSIPGHDRILDQRAHAGRYWPSRLASDGSKLGNLQRSTLIRVLLAPTVDENRRRVGAGHRRYRS